METVPHQAGGLNAPAGGPGTAPANAFVCPECGKAYDGDFALSYHRKVVHDTDPLAAATPGYGNALSHIRNAVIAGFVSTALTVVFAATGFMGMDAWSLIDATIILGLTIGVWNRNRGCAIALFVVWVLEKLFQFVSAPGSIVGIPIAIAFAVFFYQGISGTFEYHRWRAARPPAEGG